MYMEGTIVRKKTVTNEAPHKSLSSVGTRGLSVTLYKIDRLLRLHLHRQAAAKPMGTKSQNAGGAVVKDHTHRASGASDVAHDTSLLFEQIISMDTLKS